MNDINAQTLAYAAVCEAANLVHQLARFGTWDDNGDLSSPEMLIKALAINTPETAYDVYSEKYMNPSYRIMVTSSDIQKNNEPKYIEIAQYTALFICLGSKLYILPSIMQDIYDGLDKIFDDTGKDFDPTNPGILEDLANVYTNSVSKKEIVHFRIFGNREFLTDPSVQNRIRALILAAIRAVVLWRQVGGRRRNYLFKRRKMIAIAKQHLECAN